MLLANRTYVSETCQAAVALSRGPREDEACRLVLLTCSPSPLWAAHAMEESTLVPLCSLALPVESQSCPELDLEE